MELAAACGWWWVCGETAILTDRPVRVARDAAGRLHHASGAALAWGGLGLHAWRGVRVPPRFRVEAAAIDPTAVVGLADLALRRALIERVGVERMFAGTVARLVDQDGDTLLVRLDLPGDAPLVALRVRCPSTGHLHTLRVPPRTATCQEAVAWTFDVPAIAYRPLHQT